MPPYHMHLAVLPPAFTNNKPHQGHLYYLTLVHLVNKYYRLKGIPAPLITGYDCHGLAIKLKLAKLPPYEGNPLTHARRYCLQSVKEFNKLYDAMGIQFDARWSTQDLHYGLLVDQFIAQAKLQGLLERKNRIQEYCANCQQFLSHAQLTSKTVYKNRYIIKFTVVETGQVYQFMTTKPTYLWAAKAIVVSPERMDLTHLVGCTARLPVANLDVPIIADPVASPDQYGLMMIACFGSISDYQVLVKHNLPITNAVDPITHRFHGEKFANYQQLVRIHTRLCGTLLASGYVRIDGSYEGVTIVHGQRSSCQTPIDYAYSQHVYVRVTDIKPKLLAMSERIDIYPQKYRKNLTQLLENVKDWCISRNYPWAAHAPLVDKAQLTVLSDVNTQPFSPCYLDCWFESALAWLYTARIAGNEQPPTVQVQGYQILTKWAYYSMVAATIMGYPYPFAKLRLTSLLRTKDGKKFSKSTETANNPLRLIETHGVPAIRLWVALLRSDADMVLQVKDIEYAAKALRKIASIERYYQVHAEQSSDDPTIDETYKQVLPRITALIAEFWTAALEYRLDRIGAVVQFMRALSSTLLTQRPSRQQITLLRQVLELVTPLIDVIRS